MGGGPGLHKRSTIKISKYFNNFPSILDLYIEYVCVMWIIVSMGTRIGIDLLNENNSHFEWKNRRKKYFCFSNWSQHFKYLIMPIWLISALEPGINAPSFLVDKFLKNNFFPRFDSRKKLWNSFRIHRISTGNFWFFFLLLSE